MYVDFNVFQNKKGNYKYLIMKISDKDIVGYYKDKYLSVYLEGMYKECEKYLVDDKYFYYY